jgi:hypothetical protein
MTCCVPLQGGYGLPFNIIGRTNEGPFTGGGGIHMAVPGYFDTFESIRRWRISSGRTAPIRSRINC